MELMTTQISLADYCQECIVNKHKTIDRAIAGLRRWRWRNASRCRRKRR